MNNFAQTRISKLESALPASYVLPGLLAVNTVALLALDRLGGIPEWIRSAVALFLSF